MTPDLLDMTEQLRHVLDVMLAILQPALWLLLCIGFVLASAHLLTMLGTRWGDRRVSPKALLFSIAVHLSLGVAVVAMIPEYRQHILSLGQEDPPPVEVELLVPHDPLEPPQPAGGNTPAWDRIAEMQPQPIDRSAATETAPEALPEPDRPSTIQLADIRPVERPTLPAAPNIEPVPMPAAGPRTPQSPAEASLPVDVAPAEARPEAVRPDREPQRTAPPLAAVAQQDQPGRPPALETVDERPAARPVEGPLASLTTPSRLETPDPDRTVPLPAALRNMPAPQPLPAVQPNLASSPSLPSTGSPSVEPAGPQRSRTQAVVRAQDATESVSRPGLLPREAEPLPRERERQPLPRRDDPTLPELFRPQLDPNRALASIGQNRVPAIFSVRTDQDRKDEAIRKYGGNADAQRAVERALRWMASMQEPDGRWNAARFGAGNGPAETDATAKGRELAGRKSDTGVTGLVLLAMLGNGNSLSEGPYSVVVTQAVDWLVAQQTREGSLAGDATNFEAMYCHGIATLALAETYAMETDALNRSKLRQPLEKALAYSAAMQLADGGWRYVPNQQGGGDMSMFGWQLMAFRSAQDGGIPIPDGVRSKMIAYLTAKGRGTNGGLAAYWLPSDPVTPAMTAEALLCKQMLGLKRDNEMAKEAVAYLLQHRPRLTQTNLYYWYYGTLAMFQHGGQEWDQWNAALRDLLVSEQVADGEFAGSWEPRDLYSRYGGRLFSTATATLCLEVYYRRLPMYQRATPAESP